MSALGQALLLAGVAAHLVEEHPKILGSRCCLSDGFEPVQMDGRHLYGEGGPATSEMLVAYDIVSEYLSPKVETAPVLP